MYHLCESVHSAHPDNMIFHEDLTNIFSELIIQQGLAMRDRHAILAFNPSIVGSVVSARVMFVRAGEAPPKDWTFHTALDDKIPWRHMADGTLLIDIEKKIFLKFFDSKVDMRLARIHGKIIASWNEYMNSDNPKLNNYTYVNDPKHTARVYIFSGALRLEPDVDILNISHTCASKAMQIEKNWSMWPASDGRVGVSWMIAPHHVFFTSQISNLKTCGRTEDPVVTAAPPGVHLSLGTPAIELSRGVMMGVGHAKIKLDDIRDGEFALPAEPSYIHPKQNRRYRYFMFLYKFNQGDGRIVSISGFFIPWSGMASNIFFPCGLAWDERRYWINMTYGVGDATSHVITLTPRTIDEIFETRMDATIKAVHMQCDTPHNIDEKRRIY